LKSSLNNRNSTLSNLSPSSLSASSPIPLENNPKAATLRPASAVPFTTDKVTKKTFKKIKSSLTTTTTNKSLNLSSSNDKDKSENDNNVNKNKNQKTIENNNILKKSKSNLNTNNNNLGKLDKT
jgi:hypothetical protein